MMNDLNIFFAKLAFSPQVRLNIWKKLSIQIEHGLDLELNIRKFRERAAIKHSPLALVYNSILSNLSAGDSLAESIGEYATKEELLLIHSGQKSGNLSENLKLASELLLARQKIKTALISALAYPLFLLCLCAIILGVMSVHIIPQLAAISSPEKWQGLAKLLYSTSSLINSPYGAIMLIGIIAVIISTYLSMSHLTGGVRNYLDKIPPYSIYRLTVGTVWLFTMATMMRSGAQITDILNEMINSENLSPYLNERVLAIRNEYALGKDLGKAMFESEFDFPDGNIIEDLRDYAVLPSFYERLHDLANYWLTEGIVNIQTQARVLNIICIVLIICIVCTLAVALGAIQQQLTLDMGRI